MRAYLKHVITARWSTDNETTSNNISDIVLISGPCPSHFYLACA